MNGNDAREYILTGKELMLLLGSFGVKSFVGFAINTEQMSRKEVLNTLWGMSQRGLIEIKDEVFFIGEKLKNIVAKMAKAQSVIVVRSQLFGSGTICAYRNGYEYVTVEPSEYAAEQYSLSLQDRESWIEKLVLSGALPLHDTLITAEEEPCLISRKIATIEVYSGTNNLVRRFEILDQLTSYTLKFEDGTWQRFEIAEFINQTIIDTEESDGNGRD